MANLFSFKKEAAQEAAKPAPGTSIFYDRGLIPKLVSDHQTMLGMYNQILAAVSAQNPALVKTKLADFRGALQEHLLTENVKLYIYLTKQLADDEVNAQIINEFRHEMNGIAQVVMAFVRRYSDSELNAVSLIAMKKELEEIGAALVKRIQREENTLYPLYRPSY